MGPTPAQARVLDALRGHVRAHGRAPSYRELARALGLRSPQGVAVHLDALEALGLIARDAGVSKSIRIVGRARRGR